MRVIVGLGNPGTKYGNTRHNVGFMLVDGIADGSFVSSAVVEQSGTSLIRRFFSSKAPFGKTSGKYVSTEGNLYSTRFLLVKPTTYMNESGRAISHLVRKGKINDPSDLLVLVDDVNLELGKIRLREKGSAGGQNGLKSIIAALGSDSFHRLRIGIGPKPPGNDLSRFVLASFKPDERQLLNDSFDNASLVIESWLQGGISAAFTQMSQIGNAVN